MILWRPTAPSRRLLEQWAAAPDARRLLLLRALKAETLVADDSGHASASNRRWGPPAPARGDKTGSPHQPPA
jgi:hypothetical protein